MRAINISKWNYYCVYFSADGIAQQRGLGIVDDGWGIGSATGKFLLAIEME